MKLQSHGLFHSTVFETAPASPLWSVPAPAWGSPAQINAVAAFLVSRCGVAVEDAGERAVEIIEVAKGQA